VAKSKPPSPDLDRPNLATHHVVAAVPSAKRRASCRLSACVSGLEVTGVADSFVCSTLPSQAACAGGCVSTRLLTLVRRPRHEYR